MKFIGKFYVNHRNGSPKAGPIHQDLDFFLHFSYQEFGRSSLAKDQNLKGRTLIYTKFIGEIVILGNLTLEPICNLPKGADKTLTPATSLLRLREAMRWFLDSAWAFCDPRCPLQELFLAIAPEH